MFYVYEQNNTGGNFDKNERLGKWVIIEAESLKEANDKAVSIGIYFDGVYDDIDCPCCGDRWSQNPNAWTSLYDFFKTMHNTERLYTDIGIKYYFPIYSYNAAMELNVIENYKDLEAYIGCIDHDHQAPST